MVSASGSRRAAGAPSFRTVAGADAGAWQSPLPAARSNTYGRLPAFGSVFGPRSSSEAQGILADPAGGSARGVAGVRLHARPFGVGAGASAGDHRFPTRGERPAAQPREAPRARSIPCP